MAKTYTFPGQVVKSGTLGFTIVTSSGSGSSSPSEKYFSSNLTIVNETEFLGGDLQSPYCDITIEDDVDDLFRATILPVALEEDGHVSLKITLGSEILFYGVIDPSTINYEAYYASNSDMLNQRNRVSFRCIWILNLAKRITKEDYSARLFNVAVAAGQYLSPTGSLLVDGYTYVSMQDIIDQALYLVNSNFGYSYRVSYDLNDFTFLSKGDGDGASTIYDYSSYNFPAVNSVGAITAASIGGISQPCLVHGKINALTGSVPSGVLTESGTLFYDSNDDTFENAYDFFVGVLKSFGLYAQIRHNSSYDLDISIGTRISGNQIPLEDVLTASELPFSEVSRSGLDITSLQSGNSYTKDFGGMGTSRFSLQTPYDFGNDQDFPGTGVPINSIKSLVFPVKTPLTLPYDGSNYAHFQLMREIGLGANKLLNPNFASDLSDWSVDSGSWAWDNYGGFGIPAGSARVTLNTVNAQEISQTLSAESYDGLIFGGYFITTYNGGGGSGVNITFNFYDGSTLIATETKYMRYVNSGAPQPIYSTIRAGIVRRNKGIKITKVSVSIQPNVAGSASDYLYMDNMFCYKNRQGCPQLVGMQIEDYFNNGLLSRRSYSMNGVKLIYPRDYFKYGAQNYYLKRTSWDVGENETEIEAINYQ